MFSATNKERYESVPLDDTTVLSTGEVAFGRDASIAINRLVRQFGLPRRPATMNELRAVIQYTFLMHTFAESGSLQHFKDTYQHFVPAFFAYAKGERERLATLHRVLKFYDKLPIVSE